jgi:hypothetical protein
MTRMGQKSETDSWLGSLPAALAGEAGGHAGGGKALEEGKRVALRLGWRELSDPPPMEEIFHLLAATPYACFLDSSLVMERLGKYSFIGYRPFLVLSTRGHLCRWKARGGASWTTDENPFRALRRALNAFRLEGGEESAPANLPPFTGGGMGYLAYELGRYIERLPGKAVDDLGLPELCFAFYDRLLAHDHGTGKTWFLALHPVDPEEVLEAEKRLMETDPPQYRPPAGGGTVRFTSNFTREEYLEAVRRVKEYIYAGDIYQANLSQRFHAPLTVHPWILYRRLRRLNAAPFAAYFNAVEGQVCSSSPERFLKGEGRRVETRPIKGTRPRSDDPREDRRLAEELLASAKDRAEFPGEKRPGEGVLLRDGESGGTRGHRALCHRAPPGVHGGGGAPPRKGRGGPAARLLSRGLHNRGAQDTVHGDHRRAGAHGAQRLHGEHRVPGI